MYQSINIYNFRDAFHNMGRGEQFSYEGLEILFNGLEESDSEDGKGIELDVIALCCEFSESSEEDIKQYYSLEESEDVEDYLSNNSWVLGTHEKDGKTYFIYQQF